jgi:hypothetical protein
MGRGDPAVKAMMMRLGGKGPVEPLSVAVDKQLKTDPPAWETIQTESTEYVKLTDDLQKAKAPPKGTKESWEKQTAAFHESAVALEKAAQAKDLTAAKDAQAKLGTSCMECHREHRGGGRPGPGGPGGPGGPPMGGGGPPMGGGGPPMGGKPPMPQG